MQVGKFLEKIKRAGRNKAVQRGSFFLKINKHVCTFIRYTRVLDLIQNNFIIKG